jgi:hypothetical protein
MTAAVDRPTVAWFSRHGCVVREGQQRTVVIAGQNIGSWQPGEHGVRNALMVKLAEDRSVIYEDLARAFEVSSETLRKLRRLYEAEGLTAVLTRGEIHRKGGRRLAPAIVTRMERLFRQNRSNAEVEAALEGYVKPSTVRKYRKRWDAVQENARKRVEQIALPFEIPVASPGNKDIANAQQGGSESTFSQDEDPGAASDTTEKAPPAQAEQAPAEAKRATPDDAPGESGAIRAPRSDLSERTARAMPITEVTPPERQGADVEITEFAPFSAKGVHGVGAWLLLVMVAKLGFYSRVQQHEVRKTAGRPLRVALDALLFALATGERCAEGVRRLLTVSASAALLSCSAPSATWVRRTLGGYCQNGVSQKLLDDVSRDLLRETFKRTPKGEPVVLFFDNHGRAYTGRYLLRRIWRMKEKRTVPGAMDYWVHGTKGQPIYVIKVAPNVSLVQAIKDNMAGFRAKLGTDTPFLLVFDRAGAFPGLWKWLRDNNFDFVTYQRAKYRRFSRGWFMSHGRSMILLDADGKDVEMRVHSSGMNLKKERGRVRRIRLLLEDGVQINVIASSDATDQWLCQTLFSRWRQENGLKHGVERWGVNQLDGRQVENVPAGTMITNPRRTALDRRLRDERENEKKLRLQLQQIYPGHPQRHELRTALKNNVAEQDRIIEERIRIPKKTLIETTELYGELKQHKPEYKLLIDTLRCTAQYAEGELATMLAPHMTLPAEAKMLLQNIFGATGTVQVSVQAITVTLDVPANRSERTSLEAFFGDINRQGLSHPGDPYARSIRFRLQGA